ncbi:hypothetical protein IAU60_002017 [Kwoniella sp. DSM 27419]
MERQQETPSESRPFPAPANEDQEVDKVWAPYDRPRIRHLTGIRIHQLTLPESLLLASKLVTPDRDDSNGANEEDVGPQAGSSRQRSVSSNTFQASSYSGHTSYPRGNSHQRQRSSSSATARPGHTEASSSIVSGHHSSPRIRVTRPRAPTLAGEALELGHSQSQAYAEALTEEPEEKHADTDGKQGPGFSAVERKPVRCFVVLKLPRRETQSVISEAIPEEPRRRVKSDERDLRRNRSSRPGAVSRTSSSSTTGSQPATPTKPRAVRPTMSTSSSTSSIGERARTTSLTSPARYDPAAATSGSVPRSPSVIDYTLTRASSRISQDDGTKSVLRSPPSSLRGMMEKKSLPSLSISHQLASGHASPTQEKRVKGPRSAPLPSEDDAAAKVVKEVAAVVVKAPEVGPKVTPKVAPRPEPIVPFYVSPVHHPSTHPRFQGLEPGDVASWLTETEASGEHFDLEVWAEQSPSVWVIVPGAGGRVSLRDLRKGVSSDVNGLEFTLSTDLKETYHLPSASVNGESQPPVLSRNIVERSKRETRMKRGAGFGALHQLVNLQAVVADTQANIEQIRRKVDKILLRDVNRGTLRREVEERTSKSAWIGEKLVEVEKTTREAQARITLKQQETSDRRRVLHEAAEADELRRGRARDLEKEIRAVETERESLRAPIHALRAHHAQALDTLFPILPLEPSQLLYTILGVPLPIPLGPKDPAPPLSVPAHKVDEKSTAAALGYVAMLVQILGNLGGASGGLPYMITCAGSRSTVRDGTGVMQGPRSFPLYAKGVERYRYEYAVFLLNKNIEMLVQETSIRLLDIRHTLPNLKNLLLTLSSPSLPSSSSSSRPSYKSSAGTALGYGTPSHVVQSGPMTFWGSRTSSAAWPIGRSVSVAHSHDGYPDSPVGTPSPSKVNLRRAVLSRKEGAADELELGSEEGTEDGRSVSVVDYA